MSAPYYIRLLLSLLYCCIPLLTIAQHVQISGSTSATVGEPVRIQYIIAHSDVHLITNPTIQGSNVELVSGPNISKHSSTSVTLARGNTQHTSNKRTTISFTYVADKATKITLTPATFEVDGKKIQSKSHTIHFSSNSNTNQNNTHKSNPSTTTSNQQGAKGIIIRTIANKNSVYEQEALLLSYRVLSPIDIASLSGGLPSLKTFLRHDIPLPQDKQMTAETINGKLYRSVLWSQHVLFPQQTGQLTIPSFTLKGVTQEVDQSIDPLEAFFNGGNALITTPFAKKTEALTIRVKPLPNHRPDNFSGGVGQFTMEVESPTAELRTNEAYRLRVTIKGFGNHKLITPPKVNFPKSFQTFDTKSGVQTELTPDGLQGTITFDYVAVPKSAGTFDIPEIIFVYFDTQQEQFRTLHHKGFTLNIAQGSDKAEIDQPLPEDISPLRVEEGRTLQASDNSIDITIFIVALCTIVGVFAIVSFALRKELTKRNNTLLQRQRHAFSNATQALLSLSTTNRMAFYSEIPKVIDTYITDRFALTQPILSLEQATTLLAQRYIDTTVIERYTNLIRRCQQAAYAGQELTDETDFERTEALALIQQIEQTYHA